MHCFTLGHSTLAFPAFIALLRAHGVKQVADVRSFPGSRRHPQFVRAHLERALPAAGFADAWMQELGGMRRLPAPAPRHAGWREPGFRAYAAHMESEEFAVGLAHLEAWARAAATVCVCAEAEPLRCHRQLLADALVLRGWQVAHILSAEETRAHVLAPFARVGANGRLTYPGDVQRALPLGEEEAGPASSGGETNLEAAKPERRRVS